MPEQNVAMSVKGSTLTININLEEEHGESASGKTISIASTKGNIPVPYRTKKGHTPILGLNVYHKA
ncbi:MAG: hypothetical protein WC449_05310 [Candidatus Paceibacterota bacterium]